MQPMVSKGVEPICGWHWVYAHLHDLDGWTPTIELKQPGLSLTMHVKDNRALKEVVKVLRKGE